jgi:hypothetical protein
MTDVTYQAKWFTGQTSCSICLLYYTKKKPVNLHDEKALRSHLDGSVHRTAVNQMLNMHGTHAKVKAAAMNVKARKGVKVNLPINNNNFWKYALLQRTSQLSAPSSSTSTAVSAPASTPASTTTSKSKKRQYTSEDSSQPPPQSTSSTHDSLAYMLVKQQQQLDAQGNDLADIKTVMNALLSNPLALLSTSTQSPIMPDTTVLQGDDNHINDDDDGILSGPEHELDSDTDTAAADTTASHKLPQRTASAPASSSAHGTSSKRQRTSGRRDSAPPSKNTRAHS